MAKPHYLNALVPVIGLALVTVTRAARIQSMDGLDIAAHSRLYAALDALNDWSKDSTEASRRRAHGFASACATLCASDVDGSRNAVRRAINALAFAVTIACENGEGADRRARNMARAAPREFDARRAPRLTPAKAHALA